MTDISGDGRDEVIIFDAECAFKELAIDGADRLKSEPSHERHPEQLISADELK